MLTKYKKFKLGSKIKYSYYLPRPIKTNDAKLKGPLVVRRQGSGGLQFEASPGKQFMRP
jgi:hypothetical protein